ncbi:hypothetical protein ERJ75_000382900 [Trypanosoma vivax]|uniref:Uncharacterized protein n=1 Tax=Trypanosoma vivax (strain Y486) TaxID=1055687 RepID=G0TRY8_TRYVY|nr:hypothetical protein TRVL_03053 [Trypanosoma vivax]KAH8617402.1 hypothetical protein ERJ75_000382900 [Trypanosoma vivax]CCC46712.1 conserved hypothetical protein [Trypanosoma vivax Y486]
MIWRLCNVLLQRRVYSDLTGGELIRQTVKAHRRLTRRFAERRQQEGTNPSHKAQYITAYIESQSVQLARERRMRETAIDERALLSAVKAASLSLTEPNSNSRGGGDVITARHGLSGVSSPVVADGFGSWRDGSPAVERQLHSLDRNLHCIVRGATTPPAFSPEALLRRTPTQLVSVQRLLGRIKCGAPDGRASGVWSNRGVKEFTRELSFCARSVCGANDEAMVSLLGVIIQATAKQNWALAFQLYGSCVLPCLDAVAAGNTRDRSTSFLLSVLCESVRCFCLAPNEVCGGSYPPFETVSKLLKMAGRLLPVAAAPVFSIIPPTGSGDGDRVAKENGNNVKGSPGTWEEALALVALFQPHGQKRLYLPASAWGQLIRAVGRTGAPLCRVRELVDVITDPNSVKHGERHMHDTHVWNAYLSCSDWCHALELFANNWLHYDVKETAATSAALMESLLHSKQWERALGVFRRLKRKEGQLIVGTSAVYAAVFRALGMQRDWEATTKLLVDFEGFLAPLGVPFESWKSSRLHAVVRDDNSACHHEDENVKGKRLPVSDHEFDAWLAFAYELREACGATEELVRSVETALVACDPRRRQNSSEGQASHASQRSSVTAEELFDFM